MEDDFDDDQESTEEDLVIGAAEETRKPSDVLDINDPFDVAQFNLDIIKTVQTFDISKYDAFMEDQIKMISAAVKVILTIQDGMNKKFKGKEL